ncbi:MAG TPA: bifunctional acetate--CoA ligase family protein/GNAT family N-acetyltransferase [Burkholderiales bacterium]|nr:bifunctional acetate--CoA ligase family protein/GNAT family N-acetyltransferase [Burkholderiales bacterium]
MPRHYLQPLLAPHGVALVGATERPGALGDIVWRNLVAARPKGPLYPVNPKHATIGGSRAYARLTDLPEKADLAVILTPARAVPGVVRDAGRAGIKAAVVLSSGFAESGADGARLQAEMLDAARAGGVRLLGPNCLGLMRTDLGLNATFARTYAHAGKLALVSQSGALCGAILEWANSLSLGFSSVVSLGGAIDIDFGEVLDFLAVDPATDAILLYVEGIHDARRFLSALRATARVKPVIVLKVGRYASGGRAASSHTGALVGSDAVFDAALRRGGAVRVKTYIQLFAAARALATGVLPAGERLAVLTNGGGPGVIAADCAAENGVPLAQLSPATIKLLDEKLPAQWSRANPIDIIGDAPAARFGAAASAALADPGVDALLALYSPVAVTTPQDAARALAEAVRGTRKPVLAGWLGDINPNESRKYLESQGIPNFYTPENAIEAFSFLCAYRRNQAQLMEVPPALQGDQPAPDLSSAAAIRDAALAEGRTVLNEHEAKALLARFGLPVPPSIIANTRDAAVEAAKQIGYPAVLKILSRDITHKSDVGGVRLSLQNAAMVASAFDDMMAHVRSLRPEARIAGVLVQPMLRFADAREVLVGVTTDAVFGPVISFGAGGVSVEAVRDSAIALPPLNAPLARELMSRTRVQRLLAGYRNVPPADESALVAILTGVSRMVCLLPWLKEMDLNPVLAHPGGAVIADARIEIDAERRNAPGRYRHMAIHPYPVELEETLELKGTRLALRPMRPEDAVLEQEFVHSLSERSRYQRFMQHLPNLTPRMLARFTQLDYDRELALVALHEGRFIAVGRYVPNPDGETAEFALVVADDWQGKGLGRQLLERICRYAKAAGYRDLYGHILQANHAMLELARRLGFVEVSRESGSEVTLVRHL